MSGTELVKSIETSVHRDLMPVLDRVIHAAVRKAVVTHRQASRPASARTLYVLNARKKSHPTSDRDRAVLTYLRRHRRATPAELVALFKNRNIVAGAIWRLQQGGWVRRETLLRTP